MGVICALGEGGWVAMASIRMWGPKAHIWSLRVFPTCTCSIPVTWMLVSKANGPAPDLLNQNLCVGEEGGGSPLCLGKPPADSGACLLRTLV